jgi:hypothetical protein
MIRGSCLCGRIAFSVEQLDGPIGHCHCNTCRKAHSAAFSTTAVVKREHFSWIRGEEMLRSFESSPGKMRHFCSNCGTQLIAEWVSKPSVILRLGSLDDDPDQLPAGHIWVSHAVPWLQYGVDLPQFQEAVNRRDGAT